ncbi:MAG: hypothetical protein K6F77_07615 [Lachnospiraceae bacterium]|nr:hypothetical protein [Lachnospiraceae bacterium]
MRIWKRLISTLLVAVMFTHSPLSDLAQANNNTNRVTAETVSTPEPESDSSETEETKTTNAKGYVSDMKIFSAENQDTRNKRAKEYEDKGYKIFKDNNGTPVDLNESTGRDYVCLAYKTTDDESDAIRSVKMLEMDQGYEWFSYQTVAEGQMEKLEPAAADIIVAAREFKDNLSKGSKSAKYAKDYLNYLYFTQKVNYSYSYLTKEKKYPLGDYLADDPELQMIKKLIIQMNSASLTSMYSQLSLGVSDVGETWAERIEKTDTFLNKTPNSSENAIYDRLYYDYSLDTRDVIQKFAKDYREATERREENGGKIETVSSDVGNNGLTKDNVQDVIDSGNEEDGAGDILNITAYEMLNKFNVGKEKLGDYILRLADESYDTRTDMRKLYPIVEAFTNGQFGMIKVVGLAQMALFLNQSDEFYQELESRKAKTVESIKEATKGETSISVWTGVNTEFYEREVALTSDAYRQSKAGAVYTEMTRQGSFYDNMNLAMTWIGLACSVAGLVTGVVALGLFIYGSELSVWAACVSVIGTGVTMSVLGTIGCLMVIVGWVTLAAIIICAIIYFVHWLIEKFKDEEKRDYTKRPEEVYDLEDVRIKGVKKKAFIRYEPVRDEGGKIMDLNGEDGNGWNLLYYTKYENVGSPLCVDELGNTFARTVNSVGSPNGYEPVTCFGDNDAANLNSYVRKKKAKSLYLHYITKDLIDGIEYHYDDSVEEVEQEEKEYLNKGTKIKLGNDEKYLAELFVSHEDTQAAAKAGIMKKPGFKVYDYNLTPGDGYTYLGYSSTTVAKDAIRDIRIVPNFSSGETLALGDATYGSAGTLPNGNAIVYTIYNSAGPPVIDKLTVTDSYLPMESELEPVNYLCGGEAVSLTDTFNNPKYLYFKPTIAFTSGEKYISGLQFVSGRKCFDARDRSVLVKQLNLEDKELKGEFAIDGLYSDGKETIYLYETKPVIFGFGTYEAQEPFSYTVEKYKLNLYYTTTYNPYRAIYDVGIFTSTPNMTYLPRSLGTPNGSYTAAANTLLTSDMLLRGVLKEEQCNFKSIDRDERVKVISTNAYIDKLCCCDNPKRVQYGCPKIEDNVTDDSAPYRSQGLYMLGVTSAGTKAPLKEGEITLSTSSECPEGWHSVQRLTDPFNTESIDISYATQRKRDDKLYMYVKGEAAHRGKYISGFNISTYERPKNTQGHKYSDNEIKLYDEMADDVSIIGLLSKCYGEVMNVNLSVAQKNAWYNNSDSHPGKASYISFTRTDDENYAITGILMYRSDKLSPIRVKVDGIEYHRAGDKVGDYYFYYTKNPAANPGSPLIDVTFDDYPLKDGWATVIGIGQGKEQNTATYLSEFMGQNGFMHLYADTHDAVIKDLKVVQGAIKRKFSEFAKDGFNYVVKENLNHGTPTGEVYLGYKMSSAEGVNMDWTVIDDEDWEFDDDTDENDPEYEDWKDFGIDTDIIGFDDETAVRDIICVVGNQGFTVPTDDGDIKTSLKLEGKPVNKIKHNGTIYDLVSNISLNEGNEGLPIYLYKTEKETINIGDKRFFLNPLRDICLCAGDSVPTSSEKEGVWENLLDVYGSRVNLNIEDIFYGDNGHIADLRLYLFTQRYMGDGSTDDEEVSEDLDDLDLDDDDLEDVDSDDADSDDEEVPSNVETGPVKPGAEIVGGEASDTFYTETLYLKNN